MIRFNNDYNHGAHPAILKAIADTNDTSYGGYGEDEWCDKASFIIRNIIDRPDAEVRFFPGATQANFIVIDAALSPVQSVIAADTGHINCHEAASIENTGHKILALPNTDGRITAAQIEACAAAYYEADEPEYLTEPKMVYISFPTEQGTLYSLQELTAIHDVCEKYGMYLFVAYQCLKINLRYLILHGIIINFLDQHVVGLAIYFQHQLAAFIAGF